MQVKLITTIETIIEVDPETDTTFEESMREIFGRFHDQSDSEDTCESIKSAHTDAVVLDSVLSQSVTSSFEEVK